jgi:DNA-binding NarL/FixJ family response regulator
MLRRSETPLGTYTRGGYHDYESYLYSLARTFFSEVPEEEVGWILRMWPRLVPEPVHRAYMALLDEADLSTALPHIKLPVLVCRESAYSAPSTVAALIAGSILIGRDYAAPSSAAPLSLARLRADWDEHLGCRFGDAPRQKPERLLAEWQSGLSEGLTGREREVLRLLAVGKTNREIAAQLVITESTVATHVRNVTGKVGAANRTEAAAYAIRNGLA